MLQENMMSDVRTYVTNKTRNLQTYNTYEYAIIVCPNLYYVRKSNVRTYVINEYEMYSVRTYVTHENMMYCVQLYITYENV